VTVISSGNWTPDEATITRGTLETSYAPAMKVKIIVVVMMPALAPPVEQAPGADLGGQAVSLPYAPESSATSNSSSPTSISTIQASAGDEEGTAGENPKTANLDYGRAYFGPGLQGFSLHVTNPSSLSQPPSYVASPAPEVQESVVVTEAIRSNGSPGAALPDVADLSRAGARAAAESVAVAGVPRLSASPAARFETQPVVAATRIDSPVNSVSRGSALLLREADPVRPGAEGSISPPATPTPSEAAPLSESDGAATASALALPPAVTPQVASVLSVLPAMDVAVLEQGMRRFLEQVQHLGEVSVGARPGAGLGVWIVAGTAAAVACEIARRQMRSHPTRSLQLNWLAGGPPDPSSDC
jgi:hypothetical protein